MARHIERIRLGLYAVVEVPPSLREAVGRKRLRKTLATRDMATAKARVFAVVAELKGQIEAARQATTGDMVTDEARALRKALRDAPPSEATSLREAIDDRASALRGDPIGNVSGVPSSDYEFDPEREKRATAFHQLATGQATPIDEHLEQWLSEATYAARTMGDHRRAIQRLKDWGAETVEAVDRKRAGAFVSWLLRPHDAANWSGDRTTAAKYKSSLSSYWAWMKGKGLVELNVWTDQTIAKAKANLDGTETKERAFTDEELRALLAGPADPIVAVLCSNRHHRLTGIVISPRVFVLCSLWRGFRVPAFPPVGGGAVAQHRQSHADVRPRRRECFRAPALANNRRQAGVSGLRLHDLPRLSSRSLSALAMQGVRLRFLGDFGYAVRLA